MAFPNSFTNAVDSITVVSASLLNNLEEKVGVNNSTDPSSLDYKIEHLISSFRGVILPYGGASPPTGFLMCDGSAISRTTYASLFSVIGTAYGVGDGSTTFNLPDLRQRFPLGKAVSGVGSVLGATGGNISPGGSGTISGTSNNGVVLVDPSDWAFLHAGSPSGTVTGTCSVTIEPPPYQVVNYIIKY